MKELFSSNACVISEITNINAVCLEWKENSKSEEYKPSVNKFNETIAEKKAEVLIITRKNTPDVSDADIKWFDKTIVSSLKKAGVRKIIFVVNSDEVHGKNNSFPYDTLSTVCKLDRVEDIDKAKELCNSKKQEVSREILNMTKGEALKYMDLPSDSTVFAIDDKFWQLSKRYRSMNTPEGEAKLAELTAVYDIATGERDKRNKKQEVYSHAKKYFGKTSDEWKNHFHYSWYKYLIAIVLVLVAGNLFYNMVLKPRADVSIVILGHMDCDTEIMENILVEDLGYKSPYIAAADVVPSNDEGQTDNGYGEQTASTLLMSCPEIIISDNYCTSYYFPQYADCTEVYNQLATMLPADVFSKLVPIYLSEREYQQVMRAYQEEQYLTDYVEEYEDLESYSDEPIMIGIMVEDVNFLNSFGFEWKWHYRPEQIVFSIGAQTDDMLEAQNMMVQVLSRIV